MSKKKLEFSKVVYVSLYLPTLVLSSVTSVVAYLAGDANAMVTLVGAWIGMLAVGVAFYYWKAKAENVKRILKEVPADLAETAKEMLDE